jgi:molybdopterin-guanine dinucleotide biosynthesis protein B
MSAADQQPPVVHVVGWSGRGKTLLVERLLPRLVARGITVATAKHAHDGYDLDHDGSDSSRHAAAGAAATALVGPDGWAVLHAAPAASFAAVLHAITDPGVELLLVEGFTDHARNAIVLPGDRHPPDAGPDDRRFAVDADPAVLTDDQLDSIVDFCAELVAR